MPFYLHKCDKCATEKEILVKYEEKEKPCDCGGTLKRQFSGRFHGHGLPNGFSSTRSQSRGK